MTAKSADFYDKAYFLGTSAHRGSFSLLEIGPKFTDRAVTLLDYFEPATLAAGTVVEIGCGTAPFCRFARARPELCHMTMVATDITDQGVMLLEPDERPPFMFVSADRLPFEAASVAGCVLWDVLEHLPEPDLTLDELSRVLRPGGFAHIVCPNPESWSRNETDPQKDVYRRDESHIFPPVVSVDYLDTALRNRGFTFELFTRGFGGTPLRDQTGLAAMCPAASRSDGSHIVAFIRNEPASADG